MKCTHHPEVETNLGCGKCGRPICPKCMVQTPVGARCPDCARLYKLPTYSVSIQHYLKAIGTGLGLAVVFGLIWGVIAGEVPFLYINLLLAPVIGYAIGELVSLVVNRKRSTGLAVVSGISVVVSYLVAVLANLFLPWGLHFTFLDLLGIALGVFVAVNRLR